MIETTPNKIPDVEIPLPPATRGSDDIDGTDADLFKRYCEMLFLMSDPTRFRIVVYIHNHPGCGLEEIAQAVGSDRTNGNVTRHISTLSANQIVAVTKVRNFKNIRKAYTLEKAGDFVLANVRHVLAGWDKYRIPRPFGE